MSIQEDAVWPPEKVSEDDLDQTDLAKQQRESVDDPTAAPTAGLVRADEGGEGEGRSAKSSKGSDDS